MERYTARPACEAAQQNLTLSEFIVFHTFRLYPEAGTDFHVKTHLFILPQCYKVKGFKTSQVCLELIFVRFRVLSSW